VGSLVLEAEEIYEFSDQDIRLILSLADQAAVAIDNQRLLEETRTALAEVEATQRRYTVQAWEAYRGKRRTSSYEEDREGVPPLGEQLPPEVSQAVAEKKPVAVAAGGEAEEHMAAEAKSSLTVPLTVRDEVIGVLGLQNTAEARDWTPEEIAVVEAIAEQVAQAAEQIRLYDETQQRAAREQRVGEIGDKIRAAQSLEEALQVAIKEVGLSLKAPQTTVQLEVQD
jgi:GAF domain-containing protein